MSTNNNNGMTDEQIKYINYDGLNDTKLIACAGSGKTKCIIARIDRCMSNINEVSSDKLFGTSVRGIQYNKENIIMLTFSRFTRDDFLTKTKKYDATNIDPSQIKTIDSFAKTLIDVNNEIDVSLLSYTLMKYLEDTSIDDLQKNTKLTNIKSIYIDEAQDLNETQYNIFVLLKQKLGIILNFVGDPNQNIYQFRSSSDKYFIEFVANEFELTWNFRSKEPIINFSKWLRPNGLSAIGSKMGSSDILPNIIFHKNDYELETMLIDIIKYAKKHGIDLSDMAILAPTRGKMRGYGKSHGLCLISNILYKSKIKFKQFYEEATDEINNSITYEPVKGHINVLTYMGSKGLEWKYVILIDADTCLINKRSFNANKHKHDQYLLYVSCSRAKENMVIFSKYNMRNGEPEFKLNTWFSKVPKNTYKMDERFKDYVKFQNVAPYDLSVSEKRITKIIDNMDERTLYDLSYVCQYGNGSPIKKKVTKIYDKHFNDVLSETKLEQYSNIFLGRYVDELFCLYYLMKCCKERRKYIDIENIINSKFIVTDISAVVLEWLNINRAIVTWEYFDKERENLDQNIKNVIESKFSREKEILEHTIVNDSYFKSFILSNKDNIKKNYDKYMSCNDVYKMRKYLFYIIVLVHSLETQHYFHVMNGGKKFKNTYKQFTKLFEQIYQYVQSTEINFVNHHVYISEWEFIGEIDLIEQTDTQSIIWEIKCTSDITLKHVLQVLMYNIMYHKLTINIVPSIDINFINILKGEIISISLELNQEKVLKILDAFITTTNK